MVSQETTVTRDSLASKETMDWMAQEATLAEQDLLVSPDNLANPESLVTL